MPVSLLYPVFGEPVRLEDGVRGTIHGVEAVEDATLVLANVATERGLTIMAVPVAWNGQEWVETSAEPPSVEG